MRAEDAQKLATSTLDELAAALERGQSAQLKALLAAAARFHSYSFRNVMLIAAQYPEATRVAGFNAWRKLGRFVKKGEKGIAIIAPMVLQRSAESAPADDSQESNLNASKNSGGPRLRDPREGLPRGGIVGQS